MVQVKARAQLERGTDVNLQTDSFYASMLSVRSLPVAMFLSGNQPLWPFPITSFSEVWMSLLESCGEIFVEEGKVAS